MFRDALGYAIDKQKLVDNVIGGLGTIGTTQIPPVMKDGDAGIDWHTDPTTPAHVRHRARQAEADDAGYLLDASTASGSTRKASRSASSWSMPDYDPNFAKDGQFIKDWFASSGSR